MAKNGAKWGEKSQPKIKCEMKAASPGASRQNGEPRAEKIGGGRGRRAGGKPGVPFPPRRAEEEKTNERGERGAGVHLKAK